MKFILVLICITTSIFVGAKLDAIDRTALPVAHYQHCYNPGTLETSQLKLNYGCTATVQPVGWPFIVKNVYHVIKADDPTNLNAGATIMMFTQNASGRHLSTNTYLAAIVFLAVVYGMYWLCSSIYYDQKLKEYT